MNTRLVLQAVVQISRLRAAEETQSDQTVLIQAFNDFIASKKIVASEWRTKRQEESSRFAIAEETQLKSCIPSFRKIARTLFVSRKKTPKLIRIEDLLDS